VVGSNHYSLQKNMGLDWVVYRNDGSLPNDESELAEFDEELGYTPTDTPCEDYSQASSTTVGEDSINYVITTGNIGSYSSVHRMRDYLTQVASELCPKWKKVLDNCFFFDLNTVDAEFWSSDLYGIILLCNHSDCEGSHDTDDCKDIVTSLTLLKPRLDIDAAVVTAPEGWAAQCALEVLRMCQAAVDNDGYVQYC